MSDSMTTTANVRQTNTVADRLAELRREAGQDVSEAHTRLLKMEVEVEDQRKVLKVAIATALATGWSPEELGKMVKKAPGTVRSWAEEVTSTKGKEAKDG